MTMLPRTPQQIREHYDVEKRLADRLRQSTAQQRRTLYSEVYDELFRAVPHHPQLLKKISDQGTAQRVATEMRKIRRFLRPDTVFMEIGAGDCAISFEVARNAAKAFAVDVSAEIAQAKAAPPNFQLIISDGSSIPLPPQTVDLAYSNQLMEHLHPDDALVQLRQVYQALKPGGIYVCITPSRISGPHDVSKYFDTVATGFHLKEYTVRELRRLFTQVGFRQVRMSLLVKRWHLLTPTWPVMMLESMLDCLPHGLRRKVANLGPLYRLLGIEILAIK